MKDVKEYMHSEVCEANVIHQDVVAKVRENMQDEDPCSRSLATPPAPASSAPSPSPSCVFAT